MAPAGLALDAADGILYESFGANGISGINLATGGGVGNLIQTATNLVYSGNTLYFQNGTAINTTTTDLVGVNTFYAGNTQAPDGIAVLPATTTPVPEPPQRSR